MRWPRPYLALAAAAPGGPVWRMGRPEAAELEADAGDLADPVGEGGRSPLPHLVCKHPDRALLLVTRRCHFYCRFCFRRGAGPGGEPRPGELEAALAWIAERPAVREVILSGGDPLTLEDRRLAELLGRLAEIPHVETVRIHTRAPIHYPERVTAGLVAALAQGPPAWLVVHANHPVELTPAVAAALGRLRQAGLPLLDQSVLLRGVNDATATLEALFRALYRLGVRPYYLHHPDRAPGNRSFRLPLATGLRLVRPLRHRLPGPALPRYVVDLPDGSGKVEVEALTPLDGGRYRWEDPATGRSVTFRDIPEAAASPSGPICR
ncbi:MAG: KamA family radical SAM protein [Nitrospirae bacterium]|nr:MAG: KamA family radical SAM protein [Nitrospirota bacterium]